MWFNERYIHTQDNKQLENIARKFPIIHKVSSVFELFFEHNGQLRITECCDGYFSEILSVEELRQLSQYFLEVAKYIEHK